MYRRLSAKYGWTPDTIRRLTPRQQLAYLDDSDAGWGDTIEFGCIEEWQRYQREKARRGQA